MTDDLAKFLRDRLDEDEQVARGVQDRSAPWDGQWVADGTDALRTRNGWVLAHSTVTTDGRALPMPLAPGIVDHWARHDPARVLTEVDAKRRIAELHTRFPQPQVMSEEEIWACGTCGSPDDSPTEWPCATLRLLALPYAGHPDYRPEWAPEA